MGNIQLKISHKYYTKVTGSIALTKAQICYFVVWSSKDLIVKLIEPNDTHSKILNIYKLYICSIL